MTISGMTQRFPVDFEVELEVNGEHLEGRVRRLAPGSMQILLPEPVSQAPEPDQPLSIRCTAPAGQAMSFDGQIVGVHQVRGAEADELLFLEVELEGDGAEHESNIQELLRTFRFATLICGFDQEVAGELVDRNRAGAVLVADTPEQALEALGERPVAVLCLGGKLQGQDAADFLRRAVKVAPDPDRCHIVLAASANVALFQELVDSDQVYYLTQQPPPLAEVQSILSSALDHYEATLQRRDMTSSEDARIAHFLLDFSQKLESESTVESAIPLVSKAAQRLVRADRAICLVYNQATDTLEAPDKAVGERRSVSAATGLVSYVIRTGAAVRLDCVGADSRYDADADTQGGAADQRFLAVPVKALQPQTLAVLVVTRDGSRPPFLEHNRRRLQQLADQIAPTFARLTLSDHIREIAADRDEAPGTGAEKVFRREALSNHSLGFQDQGHLLKLSPDWVRWFYWLLLIFFLATALFSIFATINEYAEGIAVVRVEGSTEINARVDGTVTAVEVAPGQRVAAGQLLVRFYDAQEAAELERIQQEFELGLISRLRDPTDRSVERALSTLRAQKQLAEARLEERSVRAREAGTIGDLRVRVGQHLSPGQRILSLTSDDPDLWVVSLFPGHYRPLIAPGMPLRLELEGYRYAYQHLVVDSISEEVVGPAEARRMLGAGIGDAVPLSGSVVFVRARLPQRTFSSDRSVYEFHDGMQGFAEVRVRSESLLMTLIPGIKSLLDSSEG